MAYNPHVGPVADLLNPYADPAEKQRGGTRKAAGSEYAAWWLRRNPGRWALVGVDTTGLVSWAVVKELGLRYAERTLADGTHRVYAQYRHPDGEPLMEALKRMPPEFIELPALTKSDFNWTPAELAAAVEVMHDKLFPVKEDKRRKAA